MRIKLPKNKKFVFVVTAVGILALWLVILIIFSDNADAPYSDQTYSQQVENEIIKEKNTSEPKPTDKKPEPTPQPSKPVFDKTQYSLTDPNSPWVVINKKNGLPSSYTPPDLSSTNGGLVRAQVVDPLDKLLTDAKGYGMYIISSYRSYATQQSTYNGWVARDGQAAADTYSARPGYSEHQTGLAVDLGTGSCDLEACFGKSPAGKWLATNAHKYGFIIRYLKGKDSITGYQYEPWHLRYVGKDLAGQIYQASQTMEEFFGLPAAPTY